MKATSVSISRRLVAFVASETLVVTTAVCGAVWLSADTGGWSLLQAGGLRQAIFLAFTCQLCLYCGDLYELKITHNRRKLMVGIIGALSATTFVLAFTRILRPDLVVPPTIVVRTLVLVLIAVATWRLAVDWLMRRAGSRERFLLVGAGSASVGLASELHDRRSELGVDIVGLVDPARSVDLGADGPEVIGTIEDVPSIVRARRVTRVVVSLDDARGNLPMDKLLDMRIGGVRFEHLASVYEELTGKISIENLRPSWLIFSAGFRNSRVTAAAKRALDIVTALIGLVLAAPLMAMTALAVRLTSPGPIFYSQRRVGRHGCVFTVHKFRSMRQDAEAATGATWAKKNDDRITPFGRIMRRTRLDELPQLWNVLNGDMSMVGPRPERPEFVRMLTEQIPFYGLRHAVRPGLSGWAQVRYTYGSSVEDALEKLQYDLFYIKNQSFWFDVFIILSTVKTVVMRKGAQ
jgi:sugar transferase (PEP-CTERM system associated)